MAEYDIIFCCQQQKKNTIFSYIIIIPGRRLKIQSSFKPSTSNSNGSGLGVIGVKVTPITILGG